MNFEPLAVYRHKKTGKVFELCPTIHGTLYRHERDYEGMFAWGATSSFSPFKLRFLQDMQNDGEIEWLKTPKTNYHVWHICCCPKCCPEVWGSVYQERSGGKVWDHSQGSWDEHLRYVDNSEVGTFPTMEA